jgi:hypothetical protein
MREMGFFFFRSNSGKKPTLFFKKPQKGDEMVAKGILMGLLLSSPMNGS